ncbi:MAG TPA: DinB family protein [Dehalococcoidia bacterium]
MDFETTTAYCKICRGDVERSADVITDLADAPGRIAAALDASPAHGANGWSPPEVAAHLADMEVFRGWRIRRTLAEDTPTIESLDEETWAAALRYADRDPSMSLATFEINRRSNLELLSLAGESALNRTWHDARKGPLTLGDLVNHTSDHDLAHLRQVMGT